MVKFFARARAENSLRPKYTASAPASTAAKKASSEPQGAKSSGVELLNESFNVNLSNSINVLTKLTRDFR